jgi:S1-C subfamily serine protease
MKGGYMSNRVLGLNGYNLRAVCLMTALSACVMVSYAKEKKPESEAPPDYNSVVQVFVQPLKPIASIPWQDYTQPATSGSGFVIDGQRIMTCAHVVADATQIMVRKQSCEDKFMAKVLFIDNDADLALITVEDKAFFSDTPALAFNGVPPLQTSVLVVGYPVGGENMSYTQGIVTRIEPSVYAHSMKNLLAMQVDANVNPGNSGGPAFAADRTVLGVAFQAQKENNIYQIIPVPIIRHFLDDIKDGKVDGIADSPFLVISTMESKDMRKAFKMNDQQSGVLVCKLEDSAKSLGIFQKDDVLLSVEGKRIANNGRIHHLGHALDARVMLAEKQLKSTLTFEVLRDGKLLKVDYPLCKLPDGCRGFEFDYKPTYFITGGMVFIPMSGNYIAEIGGPNNLSYDQREDRYSPGDEFVVLVSVLADEVNHGYQQHTHAQVIEVNGKKPTSLRDLMKTVESQKTGFITFLLANKMPIIMDVEKMKASTPRILKQYRVPADRSSDLK